MRLLLDTHAILWWLSDDTRLDTQARKYIADPANDVFVSIASLWEIVVEVRVGKLQANIGEVIRAVEGQGFDILQISPTHLIELNRLPCHHRDPFDHLLIAQAKSEELTFVSQDMYIPKYEVAYLKCSLGEQSGS